MTAQQINHIAACARQRAELAGASSSDTWEAIISLRLLAWSAAEREIAANGFTYI
jgi:hypothetical protein